MTDTTNAELVPELLVADLDRSLEFWCGLCGFTISYSRPDERFAYIAQGPAQLMLPFQTASVPQADPLAGRTCRPRFRRHLAGAEIGVCEAGSVQVVEVDPSANAELARDLLDLQRSAYAREAILIEDNRIPPLHEDLDDLRSAPLLWLAAFCDRRLVGAVGWTEDGQEVDVDRLVVDPETHRQGVGSTLVRAVQRRAGKRRVVVSTGRANVPARCLYERLGFTCIEDLEVIPGLWVSRYTWTAV